jgi:hypothetical protein
MKSHLTVFVSILTLGFAVAEAQQDHSGLRDKPALKEAAAPKVVDLKQLCQHWRESREEGKQGAAELIFRPADGAFKFPPSRFRMAYKFSPNGECEWMFLDPADAHHFKPGKWEMDAKDETLLKITADGKTDTFRILELSKDILRLSPVLPAP